MATLLETKFLRLQLIRVLLPFLLVTTFEAQESSTLTYHASTSEVRLVFFATDENDRPVEELRKDDFAVVDNEKVIRDFRSFSRSASVKLDVIVLIDASESVLPRLQREIADVVQLISEWPWTPQDNVSVLSFSGTEAQLICSGDCRSSFTVDRVVPLRGGGATPLFDAVEIGADLLIHRGQPDVWPVIILFSDGDDNISKSSFDDALAKILASAAPVYAIDVSSPGPPSYGVATLQRIARDSGGQYVPIGEGAVAIFNDVIDDLHSARVVTYLAPESKSELHSVRILPTHNLNLQFRSRRGYYHYLGQSSLGGRVK
jgi:VWFA-related protein